LSIFPPHSRPPLPAPPEGACVCFFSFLPLNVRNLGSEICPIFSSGALFWCRLPTDAALFSRDPHPSSGLILAPIRFFPSFLPSHPRSGGSDLGVAFPALFATLFLFAPLGCSAIGFPPPPTSRAALKFFDHPGAYSVLFFTRVTG